MSYLKIITKLFKKRAANTSARMLVNPDRDWAISLSIFTVFLFFILLWSGYVFLQVQKGELFITEPVKNTSKTTLDQKLLNTTILFYRDKARRYDTLQKTKPPSYTDPSK